MLLSMRAVRLSLLLVALACAGCGRGPLDAPLEVTQFRHGGARGVLLNETLVVHFSEPLDPRSLTGRSVRVLDAKGLPVDGRLDLVGRRLSFEPHLPRDRELVGGSLRFGSTYTLELLGFPRVDALRSRSGEPLARTFRSSFTTIDVGAERPFLDDAPDRPAVVTLAATTVEAGAPWRLVSDQALDPRSVGDDTFLLVPRSAQGRIRLRARLVANEGGRAEIELMPLDDGGVPRLLPVGEYALIGGERVDDLADLGASPVPIPWRVLPLGASVFVEEARPAPAGPRFVESFATSALASPRAVAGAVGEARWEGDGRVRLRMPRAAGDGSDGRVVLEAAGDRRSWQATSLLVPAGARVEFAGHGLVLVAAQGALEIDGTVLRTVQPDGARRRPGEAAIEWLSRTRAQPETGIADVEFDPRESLSEFLERCAAADLPVTCFVAGGDIVVRGEVDCDGPVLFVAGGRVRIPGRAVASQACFSEPFGRSSVVAWIEALPIEIDEPDANPLVLEQTWSVVSGPIRPGPDFRRWVAARVLGHTGAFATAAPGGRTPTLARGRYDVRFLGTRRLADGRTVDVGPVLDVRLLEDCDTVRLQLDLTVFAASGPNEPWDPPWLDEIELVWE
jgi:hypothetical protein